MKKQQETGFHGIIIQVPWHQWRFFLNSTIYAYEGQDIMVLDVPNTFIQTNIPPKKYGEKMLIIKMTGVLVNILL